MINTLNIKALTFDIDDTLCDFGFVNNHANNVTVDKLQTLLPGNLQAQCLTPEGLELIRNEVADQMSASNLKYNKNWLKDVRYETMYRLAALLGVSDIQDFGNKLSRVWIDAKNSTIELYEETHDVLDVLRQHYKLGLITNGNTAFTTLPSGSWFSSNIIAHEHGSLKPEPYLFEKAVQELDVLPTQIIHIGDSLIDDVRGAQLFGMNTVWINRRQQANLTQITPDYEIATLRDLLKLLDLAIISKQNSPTKP